MAVRIQEKTVQKELANYYSGIGYAVKREVHTPVGIIDLILYKNMGLPSYQKIIIEVKEHKSIKHAIGQLLSYERYHQDCTELKVIYFCRDGKYRPVTSIHETTELKTQNRKLNLDFIGNLVDSNTLCQSQELQISQRQCSKQLNESSQMRDLQTLPPELSLSVVEQIASIGLNSENIIF